MNLDAIVVGSGFGGAISALRLAEAGKRVLVLERGRRWAPADFPRDPRDTERVFWHPVKGGASRGLYDMRFLSGVGVVAAAGVGGGSLVYANIHIRPDPDVFEGWPRPFSRAMLDPLYDMVAQALGLAPAPDRYDIEKRTWFYRTAAKLGFAAFDPNQAVAWDDPGEAGRSACQLCASCEFGCTYGAKNTLDFNYLRLAEALGVEIRTGLRVNHIAPHFGGYMVFGEDLDAHAPFALSAPRVVLSAGTLGTNEILLASRDVQGTLPALSPRLGHGFSANGDFLGTLQSASDEIVGWHGPDVTSVMRCVEDGQHFTLAAPAFNRPTYDVLASFGVNDRLPEAATAWSAVGSSMRSAFGLGTLNQPSPVPLPGAGDPARMSNLFAIGRDNAGGRMRLRDGELDIEWDFAGENAELLAAMDAVMAKIAAASGAKYAPIPTWTVFRRPLTVHPLGGCHLSESADRGVVSVRGEVHGYPGLYVADASVIPTGIGFHPAMTIAAVCEHIAAGLQRP